MVVIVNLKTVLNVTHQYGTLHTGKLTGVNRS